MLRLTGPEISTVRDNWGSPRTSRENITKVNRPLFDKATETFRDGPAMQSERSDLSVEELVLGKKETRRKSWPGMHKSLQENTCVCF